MLGLKADCSALVVCDATLSSHGSIKEITGIYLDTRLIGVHVKHNAGLLTIKLGGNLAHITIGIEHPVVIISVTIDNLLEISVIYLISNLVKSGEIHRGSRYRKNFAGRHARTVDRSII